MEKLLFIHPPDKVKTLYQVDQTTIPLTIALLTHNRYRQGYLKEALDAILTQTYADFEVLVMDNYSTDGTAEFLANCTDPRLTYVRQPPGGNATISYIRAALMARGHYIIMAHDDDIMEPTMIERQMNFLKKYPDLLVVASNVSVMDATGIPLQSRLYELAEDVIFEPCAYIAKYFEEKLWMPAPTLLFEREHYLELVSTHLGTVTPAYLASGDLWLLFTLNLQGRIGLLADPLLRYRQHGGQESRNVDQGYPMIEALELFLDNNRNNTRLQPFLTQIYAFLARFNAQNICFNATTRSQIVSGLNVLRQQYLTDNAFGVRTDFILPFEITLRLFGLPLLMTADDLEQLESSATAETGGRRGFRHWLRVLIADRGLFHSRRDLKRIAIHGSMLNAYLIRESAMIAGIEVIACFDSSPARIGRKVLDTPVYAIDRLASFTDKLDAIILSSEHDQEDALRTLITAQLPSTHRNFSILSWKELAAQAVEFDFNE